MSNTGKLIFEKLNSIILTLGFELVEVRIEQKSKDKHITIFIDSENPVSIDNCVTVHRAVEVILEEMNPTNNAPYVLNVSSLGLDWNIKTDRDLNKHMGKELLAKLYEPLNGKKEYSGILIGFDEDTFTLKIGENENKFDRKKVCKLEKVLDF